MGTLIYVDGLVWFQELLSSQFLNLYQFHSILGKKSSRSSSTTDVKKEDLAKAEPVSKRKVD